MNVRTKGFCSMLLRCGEIKLIVEKREYMPFRTLSRISRERSGAEQSPSVCNLVSPYRMCLASFNFSSLDGAEITLSRDTYKNIHPSTARTTISKKRSRGSDPVAKLPRGLFGDAVRLTCYKLDACVRAVRYVTA